VRVYAETNFALEMAFEQEQVEACEAILKLAEAKTIRLLLPAFCFIEPYEKLRRQNHERSEFQKTLEKAQREFSRYRSSTQEEKDAWSTVIGSLVRSTQDAEQRLKGLQQRLLKVVQVLPLTAEVVEVGARCTEDYGLSHPDALVMASVLCDPDLGRGPSCFMNRNTKDFNDASIIDALEQRNCKLIGRFDHGLEYVRSMLKRSAE
jgi:predicted nucleic acid-binding protein